MTGRMTRKLDNGRYAQNYTTGDGFMVGLTEMMQKLGRLEDLEEAGRLVILPKEFNAEMALDSLCRELCPDDFGIIAPYEKTGNCSGFCEKCKGCWEAALKGEQE